MSQTKSRRVTCCLLLAFSLGLVRMPGQVAVSAATSKGLAGVLEPFVDRHILAGAVVLVASRDQVLSLESVGYADIAARKPMAADTLFWIASQSKPMTAAALMMLVDDGKVKVEDPVEKYLPEFRGQMLAVEQDQEYVRLRSPTRAITVKDILSHTSGLPFSSRLEQKDGALKIDLYPLGEAVIGYAMTPLNTEPGSKYSYSNAGINTAGRIIEVVSGMPYEIFMQKRLFAPLGMKETCLWPSETQKTRLAKSYRPDSTQTALEEIQIDQLSYPLTDRHRFPSPAGGYFSTATDLSIFCRMILQGGTFKGKRYLSEGAVRQMTSTQTGGLPETYGFGWSTDRLPGGPFGHGGAYNTRMQIDPQRQLITVFLTQHASFTGKEGDAIKTQFQKAAVERFGR
jgi:CubicO group peptidase (beta-lactamase class C family)